MMCESCPVSAGGAGGMVLPQVAQMTCACDEMFEHAADMFV